MSDAAVASRYANALVDLAVETSSEEVLSNDLTGLVDFFKADGQELFGFLGNPAFNQSERSAVLDAVLPKLGVHAYTANFLKVLADRDRMGAFFQIATQVADAMDERAGRIRVSVRTVDPLTPQLEAEIKTVFEQATGKQVRIDASIDPSLIGGLVARVGGKVYDASIKSRLEDLKHRLTHAQFAAEA